MRDNVASESTIKLLDKWLMNQFVCPVDHSQLNRQENWFICTNHTQHRFPIANEIPVFLRDDTAHTHWRSETSLAFAQRVADGKEVLKEPAWEGITVHPLVQSTIHLTGGNLYRALKGNLKEYPIPKIRVAATGSDQFLLDGGCNWGRWTFAAARVGIKSVGVDPSLDAVVAARQIRQQLNLPCTFFVGDCRWLPFAEGTFSNAFSYSVIQHFSKPNARVTIAEFRRVLRMGGECMVQMPNALGIRSLYHLFRRRFRAGKNFDVRYYTPWELRAMFRGVFGNAKLSVDGFFGLGIQADDLRFMPLRNRLIIHASEALRATTAILPPLKNVADSLYVNCTREPGS